MNITTQSTGELTQQIVIQVGKEDFMPEVEKQLKKYQREARIPGFRPGKAPSGIIRRMFEKGMMADQLNTVVSKALQGYLDDNDMKLLGDPLPSEDQPTLDLLEGESFDFKFDVALQPSIDLVLDGNLVMPLLKVDIAEKEVEDYLNDLRNRHGNVVDAEISEETDFVRGTISELDAEGQALEGGISREGALISIKRLPEGPVRDRFIGLKIGDVVVFNPLNDLKQESETAGLLGIDRAKVAQTTSDFSYLVTTVNRVEPAALDETFFSMVFTSDRISSEEELRRRIRRDLEESYEAESRKLFYYDSLDMLVDKAAITLPDGFMKRWLAHQSKEELHPAYVDDQWTIYAPMLRRQILESHIMKQHDVQISLEDMEAAVLKLMGISLDMNMEADREAAKRLASSILQDEKQFDRVRDDVTREKFTSLLLEKMTVKPRAIGVDEFINFVKERNSK